MLNRPSKTIHYPKVICFVFMKLNTLLLFIYIFFLNLQPIFFLVLDYELFEIDFIFAVHDSSLLVVTANLTTLGLMILRKQIKRTGITSNNATRQIWSLCFLIDLCNKGHNCNLYLNNESFRAGYILVHFFIITLND